MRSTGRRALGIAATLALLATWSLAAAPVRAAEPTFGTPTIDGTLGEGIKVTQPITLDRAPDRVEVLLTYAEAPGPVVAEVPAPSSSGSITLRHTVVPSDIHVYPNTRVTVRWRITSAGVAVLGPEVTTVFADERFDWQTVRGDLVRVHWYEGGAAFGERALRIGEDAIEEASRLLGVTEDEPVDFFIYADRDAFYDALGPGTRENVGGQANAEIRTLFALIGPSAIDDPWVGIVVPHELVHLVFNTAVENPYHFPPRWLNEGLAQSLSQGYDPGSRAAVESAARAGELIPLDGLGGQFPTSAERFGLAYAESVAAVDYLIRTYDQDALVSLIRSYADGRTDDEAFRAAIGLDVAGFNDAWLADLGAVKPTRHGPQPAPAGPLPSAWTGGAGAPGSGASASAPAPGSSALPGVPAGSSGGGPAMMLVVGAALLIVVVAALLVRQRARSRQHVDDDVSPPMVPGT